MAKIITAIIIGVAIFGAFLIIGEWGAERYEKYECGQWQAQAKEYQDKGFFLADWQKAQCDHYGIEVIAK